MERKEFLSALSISLAVVCAGCSLSSCGSTPKSDDPAPGTTPNTGTAVLTTNLSSNLINVGESVVSNGVIVVRLAQANVAASFSAVQVACTHQGVAVNYNTSQGIYICPSHGSKFGTTGNVLLGPATVALKQYTVNITGTTLTVSA
jgi:cytochrome b6-f complex iron-sulfur subunit